MIETPRLRLEPLVAAHADSLFAPLTDPQLYTFTDDGPPSSIDALRERYHRLERRRSPDGKEQWLNWAIVDRAHERYCGFVQATVRGTTATIGYVVFTNYWGTGVGTEAVRAMIDDLKAQRAITVIRANVDARNERSMRLLRRLGFAMISKPSENTLFELPISQA